MVNYLLHPSPYFFIFDELSALGRRNALLYRFKEARFVLDVPGRSVLDQLVCAAPLLGREAREFCLQFGIEMYFHA